ncbi:MAG: sporulation initiation factor Spo0A C-terminal domain-containing protein [Longicatena sp.]
MSKNIMKKVYVCVHDYELIKDLLEYANSQREIQILGISTVVGESISKLMELEIDVLIFQFHEDYIASAAFLSKLFEHDCFHSMNVLVLFKELNTNTIHLLLQYDIKNFLVEPYSSKQMIDMLRRDQKNKKIEESSYWNLDSFASKVLQDLGIPMHLDGYEYLRTCSMIVFQRFPGKRLMIGDVYAECAKIHETTSSRVEKSIRTAVNYAYRTQPEKVCIYNNKPTNSQIILYMSERLKLYNLV